MYDINSILNPPKFYSPLDVLSNINIPDNYIVLYHGSNISISSPRVSVAESNLLTDFGLGFYLTSYYEQAEAWAIKKSNKTGEPTVSMFLYDNNAIEYDLEIEYSREWLLLVKEGRNGLINYDLGDVIIGRVADDRNYNDIMDFVNGKISLEEIEMIIYNNPYDEENDQFCFKKQVAINNHLTYIGVYYV